VVKDRVPISVIPRDEIPFSHLYMDVLGPLFGFEIGQQVLLPDSTNKWLSRWQGHGCIIDVRSPHSYLVELDRG